MSVYTLMVGFILLSALLLQGNRRACKSFIFIAFLLLFLIMGLRNVTTIGLDSTSSYLSMYNIVKTVSWNEIANRYSGFNRGLPYLMKLFYSVTGGSYQLFTVFYSAFLMISYARFIRRYSPNPLLSVLCFLGLFYYTLLFDAMKQAMAMAILLFTFDAIMEKKMIKYLLLSLLAAWFHFPALVCLPAYWITRIKNRKHYLILLGIVLILTFAFRNIILQWMLQAYGAGEIDASMEGIRFLRNKALLMIALVTAAVVLRPRQKEDYLFNSLLMFAGIAIVFQTFCGYNNIFERLADYYFHTSIILVPMIFDKQVKYRSSSSNAVLFQNIRTFVPVLIGAFLIWRYLSYYNNSIYFMNYTFFWQ